MPYADPKKQAEYFRNYRIRNRARIKLRNAKHKADFPELYRQREKRRWARDKKKRSACRKVWGSKNAAKLRIYYREYSRMHYAKYLGHHREYQRNWYAKNRKKRIAARLAYMKKHPLKVLEQARRCRKLPEPTRPMPKSCECCGKSRRKLTKNLALDHCHKSGKFRGWLCSPCNCAIGHLGDSISGLMKAIRYLRRFKK